jgi:hypothetical protein
MHISMCLRPRQLTEIWIRWDIVWLEGGMHIVIIKQYDSREVMVIVKLMIAKSSSNLEI